MGVVDQPVEDAVGGRVVADLFVPARHRQLGSEDRRAGLVAILTDLPEVAALGFARGELIRRCEEWEREEVSFREPARSKRREP
jgi:hypothetical protein